MTHVGIVIQRDPEREVVIFLKDEFLECIYLEIGFELDMNVQSEYWEGKEKLALLGSLGLQSSTHQRARAVVPAKEVCNVQFKSL